MKAIIFEEGGKLRRIVRNLRMRCVFCRQILDCPDDVDFWQWAAGAEVTAFKQCHNRTHMKAESVVAEMRVEDAED